MLIINHEEYEVHEEIHKMLNIVENIFIFSFVCFVVKIKLDIRVNYIETSEINYMNKKTFYKS